MLLFALVCCPRLCGHSAALAAWAGAAPPQRWLAVAAVWLAPSLWLAECREACRCFSIPSASGCVSEWPRPRMHASVLAHHACGLKRVERAHNCFAGPMKLVASIWS